MSEQELKENLEWVLKFWEAGDGWRKASILLLLQNLPTLAIRWMLESLYNWGNIKTGLHAPILTNLTEVKACFRLLNYSGHSLPSLCILSGPVHVLGNHKINLIWTQIQGNPFWDVGFAAEFQTVACHDLVQLLLLIWVALHYDIDIVLAQHLDNWEEKQIDFATMFTFRVEKQCIETEKLNYHLQTNKNS